MGQEQLKAVGDIAAGGVVAMAWLGVLSTALTILATGAALVYSIIRISETQRFQQFVDWIRRKF